MTAFDLPNKDEESIIPSECVPGQPTHPLFHQKTDASLLVTFDGQDDSYNPRNWSTGKKKVTVAMYALTSMGSALTSSM